MCSGTLRSHKIFIILFCHQRANLESLPVHSTFSFNMVTYSKRNVVVLEETYMSTMCACSRRQVIEKAIFLSYSFFHVNFLLSFFAIDNSAEKWTMCNLNKHEIQWNLVSTLWPCCPQRPDCSIPNAQKVYFCRLILTWKYDVWHILWQQWNLMMLPV